MTTFAARLWFAVAGLAFVAMVAYFLFSDAEWFGMFMLGSIVVVAGMLGVLAVAVRDGDVPASEASLAEVPSRRSLPAGWPALLAAGTGIALVGLAVKSGLLWLGIGIVAAVFLEWMVQGWAERATTDLSYNQALRHRVMSPFEIPALSLLVIGVFLVSLSRVLLALPQAGATVVAGVLAAAILLVAWALTARPRIGSSVLAGILAVGAVALIAAGIAGGVTGERNFEKHHAEGSSGKPEAGNNPAADEGGEDMSDPGADPTGSNTDGAESGTGADTPITQPGSESNSTPASTP